jgi:hypothetical protein
VLGAPSRYTRGMKSGGARPSRRGWNGGRLRKQTAGGQTARAQQCGSSWRAVQSLAMC